MGTRLKWLLVIPRAARQAFHPEPDTFCFADSVHSGTAADTDRRQAETMPGEPAANHAENTTVMREARVRSSVDWGDSRPGICMVT